MINILLRLHMSAYAYACALVKTSLKIWFKFSYKEHLLKVIPQ